MAESLFIRIKAAVLGYVETNKAVKRKEIKTTGKQTERERERKRRRRRTETLRRTDIKKQNGTDIRGTNRGWPIDQETN